MSYYINRITLVGNLGQDPEFVTYGDGKQLCRFSVATSRFWTNQQTGEQQSETQWHRVVVFDARLLQTCQQLTRGAYVCVEGEMRYSKYNDQNGVERRNADIHPTSLFILTKPQNDGQGNFAGNQGGFARNNNAGFGGNQGGFGNSQASFGGNQSGFNNQGASFGGNNAGFNNQGASFGGNNASFGGNNGGFNNNAGFNSQPTSAANSFNGAFGSSRPESQENNKEEDSVAAKINENSLPF